MEPIKNQPPVESKLHFLDYWRIIRIRKAIIITVFLITAIIATAVTFILPQSYESTASIKVQPDQIETISPVGGEPSTYHTYDPYFIQTTFRVMQSEVVLSNVIAKLDLNVKWGKKYNGGETLTTSETMDLLKKRIYLEPERNTEIIDISVYDEDKYEASDIANAIANSYLAYRIAQRTSDTMSSIKALEDQYDADTAKIQTAQSNVDYLRRKFNIHDTDPMSSVPTPTITQQQLQNLNNQLIEGQEVYVKSSQELDGLKKLQESSPEKLREVLPTVEPDQNLSELLNSLDEARQKLVTLLSDESTNNPNVVRAQNLVDELNREINNRVNGIMAGLENKVESTKAAVDQLSNEVAQAKEEDQREEIIGQPYWEAKRDLNNKIEIHNLLYTKIASNELDLNAPKNSMVEITDPAVPGKEPVKPNKTLNIILGVVVGLIMGVGLAFFIEYLDTSVKTIDEVERVFQTPVLGVIPQNVGYLLDEGPESPHAEAYRVLRTNILFSRKDEKFNTIVVVSAGAGEGKSTTTVNLATVFAQNGERVVVVDSDLRRPTIHKLLHTDNNLGLTNYLLKQNKLEEVIHTTKMPTLNFIPSGKLPSSSMGILGSLQMRELITDLKQRYDFVFFDSPPILGVSDASILASEVDMVVQVIQYRRYPQPMNIRAKQLIEKVGGNLIGILLNNINMSQDENYYYYSGYYQNYYYQSPSEKEQEAAAENASGEADKGGIKQKY
jgi:polysaccharide biosynthesis transport protein